MRVRIFRTLSLSLLFVITFSVALVTTGLAQSSNDTPVTFPDANLEAAIREAIDKPEGLIFTSDLDGLTSLKTKGITDLTGLEYCTNLTELDLVWNQITDISPLASLTKLTALDLRQNQISDISPLASLTNLTDLSLDNNQISDISPLANLTNLNDLRLGWNQIADISPLQNLTKLTELGLDGNQIADVSPLVGEHWAGCKRQVMAVSGQSPQ
ncbi:leucine-rich repeat domain-containing protein [Chloroflexota bacterium]